MQPGLRDGRGEGRSSRGVPTRVGRCRGRHEGNERRAKGRVIFFLSTSRRRASKRTPPRFRSYRSLFFFPLAFSSFVTPGVLWRDAATGSVVVVSNCYVLTSALDRVKEDIGERRERRGFFFPRETSFCLSPLFFQSLLSLSLSLPTLESLQEKTNLKQKGCEVLNLFISRTTKTERERRSGGRTALSFFFFFFFFFLFFFFFFSFFFCFLKASAAEAAAAARRPQEGEEAALPPPCLLPPPPPRPRPPWPGSAASPARRSAARTRPS